MRRQSRRIHPPARRVARFIRQQPAAVLPEHRHETGRVALITLPVMNCELRDDVDHRRSDATTGGADPTPAPRVFVLDGMRGNALMVRVVGPEVT
jgi:hypothetical protein